MFVFDYLTFLDYYTNDNGTLTLATNATSTGWAFTLPNGTPDGNYTTTVTAEDVAGNKTVIAVAHRLSTVQNFDRIFVMKEGRIVEEGIHQDLISKKGEYAKLYELSL